MIISITQFKLKSLTLYIKFFVSTFRVVKQVRQAGGIIRYSINPFTLRTLTAWKTEQDLNSFMKSGAHLDAMKQSKYFGTIKSLTWQSETIPSWQQAIKKLNN